MCLATPGTASCRDPMSPRAGLRIVSNLLFGIRALISVSARVVDFYKQRLGFHKQAHAKYGLRIHRDRSRYQRSPSLRDMEPRPANSTRGMLTDHSRTMRSISRRLARPLSAVKATRRRRLSSVRLSAAINMTGSKVGATVFEISIKGDFSRGSSPFKTHTLTELRFLPHPNALSLPSLIQYPHLI